VIAWFFLRPKDSAKPRVHDAPARGGSLKSEAGPRVPRLPARGKAPAAPSIEESPDASVDEEPPTGVAGVVVDETGIPVPEFVIAADPVIANSVIPTKPGAHERVIDARGEFVLHLSPGRYLVTAMATERPLVRAGAYDVVEGSVTRGIRIVLERGAEFVGTVIDKDTEQPIRWADVFLVGVGPGAAVRATTDDAGGFRIVGVPKETGFSLRFMMRRRTEGGPKNEYPWVGASFRLHPKGLTLAILHDGGPAAASGLRTGDRITAIDGIDLEGKSYTECMQLLRGPEGTKVGIEGFRDDGSTFEHEVTRELVLR
jgi:hypothetical protein